MEDKHWKHFVLSFHIVCWASTISIGLYWIRLFSLNEDSTVFHYQRYYHHESDKHPMLSLCFNNPFNRTKLEEMGTNVNVTSYSDFLKGNYFSTEMLKYDYKNIIFNISEYVVNYWTMWSDSTTELYSPKNYSKNGLRSTFAGFWDQNFYNCYGLPIPNDEEVQKQAVLLKNDIFPSKIRPQIYDFLTLFHYPNHLLRSLENQGYFWTQRTENDSYELLFAINQVEVTNHRNKNKQHCNPNGNDYDNNVQVQYSEMAACRAPYYNTKINARKCSSMQEMKKAQLELKFGGHGIIPPCRTMETIIYSYNEKELLNTGWENKGTFWITVQFKSLKFKEIVQNR